MPRPKWRGYVVIDGESPHADSFREGVRRNGNARDRCPLCDGRRLHREPSFSWCRTHNSWNCGEMFQIGCHDCEVRWGVIVRKCEDAA